MAKVECEAHSANLARGGGGHDGLVLEPHGAELEAICRGDKRDI